MYSLIFFNLFGYIILINSNILLCNGNESEVVLKFIDSVETLIDDADSVKQNESSLLTDTDSHQCSTNKLLNKFFESITPEDYEEGQQMNIYSKVKNEREFIGRIERLNDWSNNLSKTYEPILKRLQNRLSETLMTIDLPNDCLKSLVKIGVALKEGKSWALTCKSIKLE